METKAQLHSLTDTRRKVLQYSKKVWFGRFEELVLLTVASLQHPGSKMEIKRELETRLKQRLCSGSIQSALSRSVQKGFLTSHFGDPTDKQGGKRNRIYAMTSQSWEMLRKKEKIRAGLWDTILVRKHPTESNLYHSTKVVAKKRKPAKLNI